LLLVVMAVGVAALLYADALTIGLLAGAGFLFGTAISFFWPAITACMGDVVDPDRQANGASLFQISLNFTRSFAPFVGGGLLAWDAIGFGGTYVVVALILAPTLISVAFIPRAQPPSVRPARRGPMLTDVRLGAQHVLQNPPLRHAMTSFIVVILMGYSIIVVLPAFSKDVLEGGEAGFGIMFGVHAIGLLVASRSQSPKLRTYLMLSSVSLGLSISVMAFMPSFATGLLAIGGVGAAAGAFQTLVMAAILQASKPEYYGRVMALTNVGWALNNLFGLALGILADATTERTALAGLGLLLAFVSLLLARWSSSRQGARVSDVPVA
jgi:predicted MFS family arabinose efflux permease